MVGFIMIESVGDSLGQDWAACSLLFKRIGPWGKKGQKKLSNEMEWQENGKIDDLVYPAFGKITVRHA
jgi:hypothetical protein